MEILIDEWNAIFSQHFCEDLLQDLMLTTKEMQWFMYDSCSSIIII